MKVYRKRVERFTAMTDSVARRMGRTCPQRITAGGVSVLQHRVQHQVRRTFNPDVVDPRRLGNAVVGETHTVMTTQMSQRQSMKQNSSNTPDE